MPAPPKVFISATSGDLRSIRQLVKESLLTINCHPVEQTNFEPDWRTVEGMLRAKIGECQALIHIAGIRYGSEPDPATLPAGAVRRSFTQMEYSVGRELQAARGEARFRVYTFVCPLDFSYDHTRADGAPLTDEPDDRQALQAAHRAALLEGGYLHESPRDAAALQARLQALREEVIGLRQAQGRMQRVTLGVGAAILVALALIAVAVWWLKREAATTQKEVHEQRAEAAAAAVAARTQIEDARAKLEQVIEAQRKQSATKDELTPGQRYERAVAEVAFQHQLKPEELRIAIDAWTTRVKADPGASAYDLALAEYKVNHFAAAAEQAKTADGEAIKKREQDTTDAVKAAHLEGNANDELARYEAALAAYQQAAALVDRGHDPVTWANEQDGVARMLYHLARYSEAEPLFRAIAEIRQGALGTPAEAAGALNNLAQLLQATNRLADAEPLMHQALELDRQAHGPDHPDVARDLNNLAQLLQATNRLPEAEPLMRQALEIDRKAHGLNHPDVARDLNNLGLLLQATGRLPEAEPLLQQALAIDRKTRGPDHPDVARDLNNLAQLLLGANRPADAEPLMKEALEIDRKVFGPDHPTVAIDLGNLAQLLQATNRLAEAEPLMKQALEINRKAYGPDHPEVATALNNLALLLRATDRRADAEPLMRRALAIQEKAFGPDHPSLANTAANLAQVLQEMNQSAEAEPLMRRAMAIQEKVYGRDHPNVAMARNNLALLLRATGRLTEAEPLSRQAVLPLLRFSAATGRPHPNLIVILQNYLTICAELKTPDDEVAARLEQLRTDAKLEAEPFQAILRDARGAGH